MQPGKEKIYVSFGKTRFLDFSVQIRRTQNFDPEKTSYRYTPFLCVASFSVNYKFKTPNHIMIKIWN